jgi:hypothetical protein
MSSEVKCRFIEEQILNVVNHYMGESVRNVARQMDIFSPIV